ncbi:hypothetical protein [Streptomyces sp. NPDC051364]|uniref:hypothetical protein n=1 Tax=Streptomyces sp. NPDC051364 TaxID=3155799 RepID=UPI00342E3DC0
MAAEVFSALVVVELGQERLADNGGVGGFAEVDPFVDGGGGGAVGVLGDGNLAVGVAGDVDGGATSSRRSAPPLRPVSASLRDEPAA